VSGNIAGACFKRHFVEQAEIDSSSLLLFKNSKTDQIVLARARKTRPDRKGI